MRSLSWKKLLVGALAVYVAAQITQSVYQYVQEHETKRRVDEAVEEAKQAISLGSTTEDVSRWLQQQGFRNVHTWSVHTSHEAIGKPSTEDDYVAVMGWKQLREGGFLKKETWLELRFWFTPDRKEFVRIDSEVRDFPPHEMVER